MEARPDIHMLCCMNKECKLFNKAGAGNLRIRKIYGADKIRYLRCLSCGEEFSERKHSSLFNTKISEAKAVSVLDHLNEGCGLTGTAKLVGVHTDTVSRLIKVTGRCAEIIHDQKVRDIQSAVIQFDEKWSFIKKNRRTFLPQMIPMRVVITGM